MIVEPATTVDIDDVVRLQIALFDEDAGTHDSFTDPAWPREHGHDDITTLLANDDAIVLVARHDGSTVGFLVGYTTPASETRRPATYAELRSLYVEPGARRTGAATALVEQFVGWARDHDCAAAHVSHYAANDGASALYERAGFRALSLQRRFDLADD